MGISRTFDIDHGVCKPMPEADFLALCARISDRTIVRAVSLNAQRDQSTAFFKNMVAGNWQVFPLTIASQKFRITDKTAGFLLEEMQHRYASADVSGLTGDIVLWAADLGTSLRVERRAGLWFENSGDAMVFRAANAPM